jgi:Family of unknown function (DUF6364)
MKKDRKPAGRDPKRTSPARPPEARKPTRRPTNLTLDPDAVARGEEYSQRQGTSLSSLVTSLLYALPEGGAGAVREPLPPTARRLYGAARGAEVGLDNYRTYLLEKFGRDA